MKWTSLRTSAVTALFLFSLTGCGKSTPTNTIDTTSAVAGATYSMQMLRQTSALNRPTAPIGVFASIFLSQGGYFPVQSAVLGSESALQLVQPLNPQNLNDAFLLLQQFGSVLSVDVADMLNQSTDRTTTLNEYLTGLTNITVRTKNKAAEIQATIDTLNNTLGTEQQAQNDIESNLHDAFNKGDYATAGALQRDATEADAKVSKTQSDINRLRDVAHIYQQLNDLSDRRLLAITQNREILISGLRVVDVPGVKELGLIKQQNGTSKSFDFGLSGL